MSGHRSYPQTRIFLWTVPRSLGTVFLKCMSFNEGVQIFKEIILAAHILGPDSPTAGETSDELHTVLDEAIDKPSEDQTARTAIAIDGSLCTFKYVKDMLESPFPGKSFVFAHEQVFSLENNFDNIPHGYTHTFIIRNPYRLFPSWKKLLVKLMPSYADKPFSEMPRYLLPEKFGYGELYDLMVHVRDNLGQTPIIVDADDLQTNTESVLRQYCHRVGVKFTQSMLKWEAGDKIVDTWIGSKKFISGSKMEEGGYYEDAFKSTRFYQAKELPSRGQIEADLLPLIDQCMPIYEKMHSMRIQP